MLYMYMYVPMLLLFKNIYQGRYNMAHLSSGVRIKAVPLHMCNAMTLCTHACPCFFIFARGGRIMGFNLRKAKTSHHFVPCTKSSLGLGTCLPRKVFGMKFFEIAFYCNLRGITYRTVYLGMTRVVSGQFQHFENTWCGITAKRGHKEQKEHYISTK